MQPKLPDHLSHSSLDQYLRCGEYWRLDRLAGIRPPRAQPLVVGIAVHEVVEGINRARMRGKSPLVRDAAVRLAGSSVVGAFTEADIDLDEGQTKEEAQEACAEKAKRLIALFYDELLPDLPVPDMVEQEVRIVSVSKGMPDIVCRLDWVAGGVVYDLKTASKSWAKDALEGDEQITLYDLALRTLGIMPKASRVALLIDLKKPRAEIMGTVPRSEEQILALLEKYRAAWASIHAGIFLPASYRGWWCGQSCGYAKIGVCRYVKKGASHADQTA